MNFDLDYEIVPFNDVIGVLERILFSREAVERATPSEYKKNGRNPSINQITETAKKKGWQEDWARKFKGVLYCRGAGHEEELNRLVKSDPSLQVKFVPSGKQGPFALLGYNSDDAPTLSCINRPFRFGGMNDSKSSKN